MHLAVMRLIPVVTLVLLISCQTGAHDDKGKGKAAHDSRLPDNTCGPLQFAFKRPVVLGISSSGCEFPCRAEALRAKWALMESNLMKPQPGRQQCNFGFACFLWTFLNLGDFKHDEGNVTQRASTSKPAAEQYEFNEFASYTEHNAILWDEEIYSPPGAEESYEGEMMVRMATARHNFFKLQEWIAETLKQHSGQIYEPERAVRACLCLIDIRFERIAKAWEGDHDCSFSKLVKIFSQFDWVHTPATEMDWKTAQHTEMKDVLDDCDTPSDTELCKRQCQPVKDWQAFQCIFVDAIEFADLAPSDFGGE